MEDQKIPDEENDPIFEDLVGYLMKRWKLTREEAEKILLSPNQTNT